MYEQLKAYDYLYDRTERKQLTAEAIKAFRIESGLQQKEVAELLKINTQTYQTYENGRSEPPIEILVRLSLLYEVPIDILVQKNNYNKDNAVIKKIVNNYSTQIAEVKSALDGVDPLTKAQTAPFIQGLELITKFIADMSESNEENDNSDDDE